MIENFKRIRFIIERKHKFKILLLYSFLIIGMTFEVLLLALIIPVIKLITDKNEYLSYVQYFNYFSIDILDYNYVDFSILGLIFLTLSFFLKNLFLIYLNYKQNQYVTQINADITSELYKILVDKDYEFFQKKNSSELVKNFQLDIGYFAAFFQSFFQLTIELFLSFSVIIGLLYLETISAFIAIFSISIFSTTLFLSTRKKINSFTKKRKEIEDYTAKLISESFQGIKEVKINNKGEFYQKLINNLELKKAKILSQYQTINQTPRFILETLGILTIVLIISYKLFFTASQSSELYSSVSLFVAATFRLLPSVNRVISSFQNINYFSSSVEVIFNYFKTLKPLKNNYFIRDFGYSIIFKNVEFSYSKKPLLKRVDIEIPKGSFIGITGKSGSGKSTLINLLVGLLKPTKGEILIDDSLIGELFKSDSLVGYVPQQVFLLDDTIENNITLNFDNDKTDYHLLNHVLDIVKLKELVNDLELGLKTKVGERGTSLSGGQMQRIGIARALYKNPKILIFDESTSSLDIETERILLDNILKNKNNMTFIFISHKISNLNKADLVYNIENGLVLKSENDY